eukprot:COSAG05_NODE_15063_length_379_cov_0.910714_1_plen_109_part_10
MWTESFSQSPTDRCYVDTIGLSNELWRANIVSSTDYQTAQQQQQQQRNVSWNLVGGGMTWMNSSAEQAVRAEPAVWPRARAAAMSWQADLSGDGTIANVAGDGGSGGLI